MRDPQFIASVWKPCPTQPNAGQGLAAGCEHRGSCRLRALGPVNPNVRFLSGRLTRILRARERPLLFQRTVHFVDTNCAALGADLLLELATSGSFGLTLERCEDAAFLVFENSAAVLFLEGVALQHGTDPLNSSH